MSCLWLECWWYCGGVLEWWSTTGWWVAVTWPGQWDQYIPAASLHSTPVRQSIWPLRPWPPSQSQLTEEQTPRGEREAVTVCGPGQVWDTTDTTVTPHNTQTPANTPPLTELTSVTNNHTNYQLFCELRYQGEINILYFPLNITLTFTRYLSLSLSLSAAELSN